MNKYNLEKHKALMNAKEFYNKDRKTKVDFDSPQAITPKHSPEYVIDFAERYLLHIMSNVGIQTHAERMYERITQDGNYAVNKADLYERVEPKPMNQGEWS